MLKANEIRIMYLNSIEEYSKFYLNTSREKVMAKLQRMVDRNLMTEEEKIAYPVKKAEKCRVLAEILQRNMDKDLFDYFHDKKLQNFKISA